MNNQNMTAYWYQLTYTVGQAQTLPPVASSGSSYFQGSLYCALAA